MKHNTLKSMTCKALGLTAAFAMMAPTLAMADTADSALVQGGALNLREKASLTAKVLGQYPTGTMVEIIEEGSTWHKVEVDGKTGYMMAKYLNTASADVTATVRTNTGIGLNLREEPSMQGKIITSYKPGTKVTVLQKGASWSRVKVNDAEGFMATQYLKFSTGNTGSGASSPNGTLAHGTNPKDTHVRNLRKDPSLDAKVLDCYRNGVKVTILKGGSTWHKVQVEDGKTGYMMAKFLKVTNENGAVQPFKAKLINVNGGKIVNFRSGPSLKSSIIRTVPVGTEVTVLEHGADWCKVQVGEDIGYISTWFMKW